ncbi:DNA repair protein RecO [Sediminitomix flava]|uniref:DNA repair protein RecO n=1 Tax=Sediminitomix flava TaxID=379075 RepID=A0A315ZFB9_SEDFL|nr:DNA repair protein RecO [Sediminitomix flava]PWJ44286.1 DNA replication and repair protein RecO [Sediminitomix flava]
MQVKTRGIVINSLKYGDTSLIVRVFTEALGFRTYMVKGARQKKSAKVAMFQPLTLVEFVAYEQPHREMQRMGEVSIAQPYYSIGLDIRKNTIAFFLSEVLFKILKGEAESYPTLFQFLWAELTAFDQAKENFSYFHLYLLLACLPYLGLDIGSGENLVRQLSEVRADEPKIIAAFDQLLENGSNTAIQLSSSQRDQMMEILLKFYQWHYPSFGEVKSLDILRSIFH